MLGRKANCRVYETGMECMLDHPEQGLEKPPFLVSEGASWLAQDESLDWTS